MNKKLYLAIIFVSLIPAIFSIGREMKTTGHLIADTGLSSTSALLVANFISIAIIIAVAIIYLMKNHTSKQRNSHHKHAKHIKSHSKLKINFNIMQLIRNNPENYMVLLVALVGFVSIIVIVT